jgi:hypothetical protein
MTNWAEQITRIQATAVSEIAERRARVLRYPDLAARLTRRPLEFSTPEKWNGYVPPKTVPTLTDYKLNDSARRAALVEICAEAMRRDAEEGLLPGGEAA